MQEYLTPLTYLFEEMAPYLLLGFLIAGILHAFVPRAVYSRWLSGNDLKSVLLSIAFGIPLPLCSCGVIPTAVSMRKEGASKGATTAFLIATPQTGVDSIAATWSVLGLPFAILRPVAAMVTGLFGGLAAGAADKEGACSAGQASSPETRMTFPEKCRSALKYGFSDMIQDIGPWLVIGLILAAVITVLVPDDFFIGHGGSNLLNMLLVLVVAVPMYVCATGSIPIAAALIMKGLNPGAALVFLMAGPATNIASMLVLGKTLGKKSLAIYLISIIIGAVCFGLAVDWLLPTEWFSSPVMSSYHSACCHEEAAGTPWWQILSSLVLAWLLARALVMRFRSSRKKDTDNMKTFIVKGMVCNHCKANVQNHIAEMDGVKGVDVDLASGIVSVEGEIDPDKVVKTVTSLGYDCELKK